MKIDELFKEKIDEALFIIMEEYPSFDLPGTIAYYISNELKCLYKSKKNSLNILNIFHVEDKNGRPLRSEIKAFFDVHKDLNLSSELLKLAIKQWKVKEGTTKAILEMINIYTEILDKLPSLENEEKEKFIENYKEYLENEELTYDIIEKVMTNYINHIDDKEIKIKPVSDMYEFLTNIDGIKLIESLSGKMLEGHIQIATEKGTIEKPQQDAVLSIVKDENIFLNVVADGAGASQNGENASREFIVRIKNWFESLESFDDIDYIVELLKQKINEINNEISRKYRNCYTTFALALTIGDKTIIANIGDSTVYSFDGKLELLTQSDSLVQKNDYEEMRRAFENNLITQAVGDGPALDPHIKVIDNIGQRIIISTDGITDLVSDKTFKSYFTKKSTSEKIIDDALNHPETSYEIEENGTVQVINLPKQSDNMSVIIVDLEDKTKKNIR